MSKNSNDITRKTASQLVASIKSRELTSLEVTEAHIQRIEDLHSILNAVVVPHFEQARKAAREADEKQARGDALGLLHGLPITVKEMFDVEGLPTSAGLQTLADHRANEDAVTVKRLKDAGAIVLGKTNIPQMGMLPDAVNYLYGRTPNPWNDERTPGGSSGGEAAVIATGGSPLGLGSDGGGSIRNPCHSCGIFGLKPTGLRLPFKGHWGSPNWYAEWVTAGPMARSVEDLDLAMRVLTDGPIENAGVQYPGDVESFSPISDYRSLDAKKLRVGYFTQLGWLKPAPSTVRVVYEAAHALDADGFEVKEFMPPQVERGWAIYYNLFYSDAFQYMRKIAKGNKLDWRVRQVFLFTYMPTFIRPLFSKMAKLIGEQSVSEFVGAVPKRILTKDEVLKKLDDQDDYRQTFLNAMVSQGVDVLIGPPCPTPAITPKEFLGIYGLMYTALFNLLAMPAGVIPASRVQPGEETSKRTFESVDRSFARIEKGSQGLPVGLQVVAPWWREDRVFAIMEYLASHFRGQDSFPVTPMDPQW